MIFAKENILSKAFALYIASLISFETYKSLILNLLNQIREARHGLGYFQFSPSPQQLKISLFLLIESHLLQNFPTPCVKS